MSEPAKEPELSLIDAFKAATIVLSFVTLLHVNIFLLRADLTMVILRDWLYANWG